MSGARVETAREEPLAEGLPDHLAAKLRKMSHEEVVAAFTAVNVATMLVMQGDSK